MNINTDIKSQTNDDKTAVTIDSNIRKVYQSKDGVTHVNFQDNNKMTVWITVSHKKVNKNGKDVYNIHEDNLPEECGYIHFCENELALGNCSTANCPYIHNVVNRCRVLGFLMCLKCKFEHTCDRKDSTCIRYHTDADCIHDVLSRLDMVERADNKTRILILYNFLVFRINLILGLHIGKQPDLREYWEVLHMIVGRKYSARMPGDGKIQWNLHECSKEYFEDLAESMSDELKSSQGSIEVITGAGKHTVAGIPVLPIFIASFCLVKHLVFHPLPLNAEGLPYGFVIHN